MLRFTLITESNYPLACICDGPTAVDKLHVLYHLLPENCRLAPELSKRWECGPVLCGPEYDRDQLKRSPMLKPKGHRLAFLSILLAIGCCLSAMAVTAPPAPPKVKPRLVRHHDLPKGATLLMQKSINPTIQKSALVAPPPAPRLNNLPAKYPEGINPDAYWWNLETTTNLRTWTVVVTNATGWISIPINVTEPCRFFRLSGRLTP